VTEEEWEILEEMEMEDKRKRGGQRGEECNEDVTASP
jgi:hypothetical protein